MRERLTAAVDGFGALMASPFCDACLAALLVLGATCIVAVLA